MNDAGFLKSQNEQSLDGEEQHWIESESLKGEHNMLHNDDEEEEDAIPECFDLFADPDPFDTFSFSWAIKHKINKHSSLNNPIISVDKNDKKGQRDGDEIINIQLRGYKKELGQTLHSTGLTLWRASELLCNFLVSKRDKYIENKTILELGAGLGLCGILAYHLGATSVVLTDGDTDCLTNLRANVQHNCENQISRHKKDIDINIESSAGIKCKQLVWGNKMQIGALQTSKFDIILGADIIYIEEILDPLWDTVLQLLVPDNGRFLLAYARRNVSIDLVFGAATKRGFVWDAPSESEGVYIFRRKDFEEG